MVKEGADYGFDETHHAGSGRGGSATTAVPRVFAQQPGSRGTGKFYERGAVRIYYEEAGSGFPLMLLPGGGLNSTISFFNGNSPFNAIEEFKGEYRCITAGLRNAPSGQSTGPVEIDRPWESYADDQLIPHSVQSTAGRPRKPGVVARSPLPGISRGTGFTATLHEYFYFTGSGLPADAVNPGVEPPDM